MEEILKFFSLLCMLLIGFAMAIIQPAYATDIQNQPVFNSSFGILAVDQNTVELNYEASMMVTPNNSSHLKHNIIKTKLTETKPGLILASQNRLEVETVLKFPYLIQNLVENTNIP